MMEDGGMIFILAVVIVAVLLLIAIKLTGRRTRALNKEEYQTRFLAIENKLRKDNTASYMTTVIEGDRLLDRAMTELGVAGKTMGERLKKAGGRFSELDAVWRAHKLRNAIAHEADTEVSYKQAAGALAIYKQALKDLGAI